jgi:hypothetical protein
VGEEYWEYIAVLASVVAHPPGRPYLVVEVGAGYCHWTVAALVALRSRYGAAREAGFVALEGGKVQLARCAAHLGDNGIPVEAGQLVHAALVPGAEASVRFSQVRVCACVCVDGGGGD